jgi:hypothetical protein
VLFRSPTEPPEELRRPRLARESCQHWLVAQALSGDSQRHGAGALLKLLPALFDGLLDADPSHAAHSLATLRFLAQTVSPGPAEKAPLLALVAWLGRHPSWHARAEAARFGAVACARLRPGGGPGLFDAVQALDQCALGLLGDERGEVQAAAAEALTVAMAQADPRAQAIARQVAGGSLTLVAL